jgi:NAD(P)-dependent dehydrogenase (short-subunit alcohol dehydrogenase family)
MSLAVEWAPKVRVNAVVVGPVRTELSHLHYGDDEGVREVAATIPLGRLAEPEDVGAMCAFLASSWACYVSGALIALHGGGERPAFLAAAGVNTTTAPTKE